MKKSLQATSIIEAIIVLIVVVVWIIGVYDIMISSQRLSNSTADRIEAIQIARDGLEAFTNIRDTNWQLFAADYENCWNAINYDNTCIWNSIDFDTRIRLSQIPTLIPPQIRGYKIYKNSNNQFELWFDTISDPDVWYSDLTFRSDFGVSLNSNGFYTQSWGTLTSPLYTRYIRIDYINTDGGVIDTRSDDAMKVTAVVEWFDSASSSPRKIEMDTTLTNWKAKR